MAEQHATVLVDAPVAQVYQMFTHFNDFPKFMHFVKEVTYKDAHTSHWVADVIVPQTWDAVNENWVENQQVGWRSTGGLENTGKVTFEQINPKQTKVDVSITYTPPASIAGEAVNALDVGKAFGTELQTDLTNFAKMVHDAPEGALDPTSSNYLFHSQSAAAQGRATDAQQATM